MNIKNLNKLNIEDLNNLIKKEGLLKFVNKKSNKNDLIKLLLTNSKSKKSSIKNSNIIDKSISKKVINEKITGFTKSNKYDSQFELPQSYERTHITLMSRDPYWVFSYWNISKITIDEFKKAYHKIDFNSLKLCLQIIKKDNYKETFISDILPDYLSNNYYIKVPEAGQKYYVDLGFLTQNEEFIFLARSNIVETPNDCISHNIDNRWITPENFISVFSGININESSYKLNYGKISTKITNINQDKSNDKNDLSNSLSSILISSRSLSSGVLSSAALSSLILSSSNLTEENLSSSLLSSSSFSSQILNLGVISSFSVSSGILSSFTASSGILSSGILSSSEIFNEILSSSQLSSQSLSSSILKFGILNETTLSSGILSSYTLSSGILSSGVLSSFIENYGSLSSGILSSGILSSYTLSSGVLSSGALSSFIENYGNLSSGILSSGILSSGVLSSGALSSGILSSGILSSGVLSSNSLSSSNYLNEYYSSLNLSSFSFSSNNTVKDDTNSFIDTNSDTSVNKEVLKYSERMYKPFSSYHITQSRLNNFKLKKEETFWN